MPARGPLARSHMRRKVSAEPSSGAVPVLVTMTLKVRSMAGIAGSGSGLNDTPSVETVSGTAFFTFRAVTFTCRFTFVTALRTARRTVLRGRASG